MKTGMYYLRARPAAQAIQFTVDQSVLNDAKKQQLLLMLPPVRLHPDVWQMEPMLLAS